MEKRYRDNLISQAKEASQTLPSKRSFSLSGGIKRKCLLYMISPHREEDIQITGKIPLNKPVKDNLFRSGLYTDEAIKGLKSIPIEQII